MSRVAYFDCFAGVSGDMILGALLDAGLELTDLEAELSRLDLDGYKIGSQRVVRGSIAATQVSIEVSAIQTTRTLEEITRLVEGSRLPEVDRYTVVKIFRRLAEAEAQVHGNAADSVHFHDVGAVDAIVDIAGAVAGLRLLGVEEVYSSGLPLGSGSVSGPHGVLPVPSPATLALVSQGAIPTRPDPVDHTGELSTPTGAAILSTLARFERPALSILATGYGAGARDPDRYPNVLRVWLGEPIGKQNGHSMLLIETNVDDMAAEQMAYAMERLLAAGAADVWFTPIQMKKGRPGIMLSLLCREDLEEELSRLVFRETSTFGLRVSPVHRHEAEREIVRFQSSLGEVAVKLRKIHGEPPLVAPEFEACRTIAEAKGLPLRAVMDVVRAEAERHLLQAKATP